MWFITCLEKMNTIAGNIPVFGDVTTWGFYSVKSHAVEALHDNSCDMHEGIYQYACIERYEEGIARFTGDIQWFRWDEDRNGYFEIDTPDLVENCCGFAM